MCTPMPGYNCLGTIKGITVTAPDMKTLNEMMDDIEQNPTIPSTPHTTFNPIIPTFEDKLGHMLKTLYDIFIGQFIKKKED